MEAKKGSNKKTNNSSSHSNECANSVASHNNSWYHSEFAFEPVDKVKVTSFPSISLNCSTSSSLKRLKLTDSYSVSRHPAVTAERYSYMDSCGDVLRRDTSLRYSADPERLATKLQTTSRYLPPRGITSAGGKGRTDGTIDARMRSFPPVLGPPTASAIRSKPEIQRNPSAVVICTASSATSTSLW